MEGEWEMAKRWVEVKETWVKRGWGVVERMGYKGNE